MNQRILDANKRVIRRVQRKIEKWNRMRSTNMGLSFLTSGFGIEISRLEYECWKEEIDQLTKEEQENEKIHMYFAVSEFELIFYLVNSSTEKSAEIKNEEGEIIDMDYSTYELNGNLFEKDFTQDFEDDVSMGGFTLPSYQLTDNEAKERAFRWFLYANSWFKNKLNNDAKGIEYEVPRVIEFGFSNLAEIFESEDDGPQAVAAFLFFGLKKYKELPDIEADIEVMMCSRFSPIEYSEKDQPTPRTYKNVSTPKPPFLIQADDSLNLLK